MPTACLNQKPKLEGFNTTCFIVMIYDLINAFLKRKKVSDVEKDKE